MGRKKKEKKGRKKTKCGFLRSFPKVAFLKIEGRHKKTTIHRIQRQDANDETGEVSPKVKQRNGDDRIEKRDDVFGDYFRCAPLDFIVANFTVFSSGASFPFFSRLLACFCARDVT